LLALFRVSAAVPNLVPTAARIAPTAPLTPQPPRRRPDSAGPKPTAPPSQQPLRCLGRLTAVPTVRSRAAARLRSGRRRRLRPGKPLRRRVFAPSRPPLTSPPSSHVGRHRAACARVLSTPYRLCRRCRRLPRPRLRRLGVASEDSSPVPRHCLVVRMPESRRRAEGCRQPGPEPPPRHARRARPNAAHARASALAVAWAAFQRGPHAREALREAGPARPWPRALCKRAASALWT
jgi:hypothetical protein